MSSDRKKTVDEIWRELNTRSGARQVPRSATTGVRGFGLPGVTTHTRVLPRSDAALTSGAPVANPGTRKVGLAGAGADSGGDPPGSAGAAAATYDSAAAAVGVATEELTSAVASMQRHLNCLSDADRATRRGGLDSLRARLSRGSDGAPPPAPPLLQALLVGPLMRPLCGLLADPVEGLRLGVLTLLRDAVRQLPAPGALLPGLLPPLVARMGTTPVQEPAEEVRLAALQLLEELVRGAEPSLLASAADDAAALLVRGLEDGFPDAKRAAAACLSSLTQRLPPGGLERQAERLLQAILPNLSHQHSRVRLAALSGLQALVLCGLPAGDVERLVVPGVTHLAGDHAASVRQAYYAMLAAWLGCSASSAPGQHQQQQEQQQQQAPAPEGLHAGSSADAVARCQTHAVVLLPLLLLGVSDQQESIAAAALAAVEQAGNLWDQGGNSNVSPAQQQQQQQQECEQPHSVDRHLAPAAAPMDVDLQQQQPQQQQQQDAHTTAVPCSAAVAAAQLPPPYTGLPSAPCQAMVTALLPQVLPVVLHGLQQWTVSLRCAAARTLHALLVLTGPAAAAQLPRLLPVLVSAVGDDDADVALGLVACCRVVGALVPASAWLPLLVDTLADGRASQPGRANALVVSSCMLHAAAAACQQPPPGVLTSLVHALAVEETRCSDHVGVRTQLLATTSNVLAWMPNDELAACAQCLYLILLQLYGTERGLDYSAASTAISSSAEQDSAVAAAAAAAGGGPGSVALCGAHAALDLLAQRTAPPAEQQRSEGDADAQHSSACVSCDASGAARLAAVHGAEVLPALTADAQQWTAGSPNLLALAALLRTSGASGLSLLLPAVSDVLAPLLADAERDATLRLALLRLLDELMEAPSCRDAFTATGNAELTLRTLLLPPLVWRAGKAAAAVRFAAVTALATLVGGGLAPADVLATAANALPLRAAAAAAAAAVQSASSAACAVPATCTLLPLLAQCLDEEWYADVRLSAAYVVQELCKQVGPRLSDDAKRAVYTDLLKRLDDSSNKVRIAACGALREFAAHACPGYCATNVGYLAAGLVLHMDDCDGLVAEAACQAMETLAAVHPRTVEAEMNKVSSRFRARHFCDRVWARLNSAGG